MSTMEDVILTSYATRQEWLDARIQGIGASESAALFGLSPWDSELSLWTKKRGLDESADEEKEWMEIGTAMEPVVAALYQKRTGRSLWAPSTSWAIARHPEVSFMTASIDRWVIDAEAKPGRGVLEMKNVGFGMSSEWEEGPPLRVTVQLMHQLAVTGFQWGSVAGILGGNKFVWFDFERNEDFIEELKAQCARFWDLVTRGKMPPPDGSEACARALKKLYPRDSGEGVVLPVEAARWHADLVAAKAAIKAAEARKSACENLLRAAIGPATFGTIPNGPLLSLRTIERAAYAVEKCSYRVLREEKRT